MELCSGGSLFTLLENPANAYGFAEDDFKQVVKDVGKDSVTIFFFNTGHQAFINFWLRG